MLIALNKWDWPKAQRNGQRHKGGAERVEHARRRPLLTGRQNGKGIDQLLAADFEGRETGSKRVSTGQLNAGRGAVREESAPAPSGREQASLHPRATPPPSSFCSERGSITPFLSAYRARHPQDGFGGVPVGAGAGSKIRSGPKELRVGRPVPSMTGTAGSKRDGADDRRMAGTSADGPKLRRCGRSGRALRILAFREMARRPAPDRGGDAPPRRRRHGAAGATMRRGAPVRRRTVADCRGIENEARRASNRTLPNYPASGRAEEAARRPHARPAEEETNTLAVADRAMAGAENTDFGRLGFRPNLDFQLP